MIGLDRVELVRDLQRELSRVGCYNGSLDGQWNGATRQSMGDFLARVNARLPLNSRIASCWPSFEVTLTIATQNVGRGMGNLLARRTPHWRIRVSTLSMRTMCQTKAAWAWAALFPPQ